LKPSGTAIFTVYRAKPDTPVVMLVGIHTEYVHAL
jgi:hypothetical protein